MFENCATLEELAKARATELRNGTDALEVNREYSQARKRFMTATPSFAKIPVIKITCEPPPYGCVMRICGKSGSLNKMVIAEEGVYVG